RRVDGVESFLDPVSIYFDEPGHEQQVAHPNDGGDECTQILLDRAGVASLWGDLSLPRGPVFTSAAADLAHRQLVSSLRAGDTFELVERVGQLLAGELGFADQAHLARVVRREVGATPSALRSSLGT